MTSALHGRVASTFGLSGSALQDLVDTYMRDATTSRASQDDVRRRPAAQTGMGMPVIPARTNTTSIYELVAAFRKPGRGGAVLDIGSGAGETLAAFASHGFEPHGIEPNVQMRARTTAVLASHGKVAVFHDADLDVGPIPGQTFDVIICNSMIEHAGKPHAMIINLARMLAAGGILVLGVANGDALGNAIADPHHGRFGLTLLRPDLAAGLYQTVVGAGRAYDVTGFLPIAHYAALMRAEIGEIKIAPNSDPRTIDAVPDLLARLAAGFADAMGPKGLPGNSALRQHLKVAFAAYTQRVLAAYRDAVDPGEAEMFRETYIRKFVHMVAIKSTMAP